MDESDRSPAPHDEGDDQPPSGPRASIEVIDATGVLSVDLLAWLRGRALAALGEMGNAGSVRVRIVDDAEMSVAHERYAGVSGTTDILTFDLSEPCDDFSSKVLDIDLIICVDRARRQGEDRGHGTERELLLYIVHGVLHCLGYDDHDESGYRAMHEREDEILSAIGVGRTFFVEGSGS